MFEFNTCMKIITQLKRYIKSPTKCFTPKCRARCCIEAPLPEGFINRFESRIQRPVYGGLNIGINDPKDNFNSIIYNTRPIQIVNVDRYTGKKTYGISKEMMERLELKSMDDVYKLLNRYEAERIYNYCPFVTTRGKCSVYEYRPPICREFGTSPTKGNICPEKSSRLDILKFILKNMFKLKNN